MPTIPHRIRRQRWTVRAGSAAAAFNIRQHLRDDWQRRLLPAFEQVFDQEVPGTVVVHIPKIELNLNVGPEEKVGARWTALLHDQLLQQLREILRTRPGVREKSAGWKKTTARENRFQDLLHYLHSGFLTWPTAGIPAPEVVADLQKACREQWPELQALLQAAPVPSFEFCFRLLELLSAAEASGAVRAILGDASFPWETSLVEILVAPLVPEKKLFGRYTQLQLAALLLSEALAARRDKIAPDLARIARRASLFEKGALDYFIASLPTAAGPNATSDSIATAETAATNGISFRTENSNRTVSPKTPTAFQKKESAARPDTAVPDFFPGIKPAPPFADAARNSSAALPSAPVSATDAAAAKEIGRPSRSSKPAPPPEIPDALRPQPPSPLESATGASFSLLANHAGLILLHPFFPRFFDSAGIKEETDAELSPFALAHAAALLHYLATGRDDIHEYDLVLTKVLLGVNPEMPLCVSEGLITEADVQETEALLQSVITHWTALRNTSIAGFRSSFLDRLALLKKDDNGWRLQVERQSFDVLLEHLPWSISVVKLPWMQQPLYTEW